MNELHEWIWIALDVLCVWLCVNALLFLRFVKGWLQTVADRRSADPDRDEEVRELTDEVNDLHRQHEALRQQRDGARTERDAWRKECEDVRKLFEAQL